MTDSLTVLRHSHSPMAKTWRADGSIEPYGQAKHFTHQSVAVSSIAELSAHLAKLERDPFACVIRGRYKGDAQAAALDADHKPGTVRRLLDLFDDAPRRWMLVEIDNYEPLVWDPVEDAADAIDEFLFTSLPAEFHSVSYHWQLSNSAGHAKNAGKLKAHVWFWLETAYTSAQLLGWAKATAAPLDTAVLNPVQVHYTAAPRFVEGVVDPVAVRSGYREGLLGDAVPLVITAVHVDPTRQTKMARLSGLAESDPVVRILNDRGMVKSVGSQGELRVVCPRASHHTGDSAETSTLYYLPHTGGFARGGFVCLHAHCKGVPQSLFCEALGYDPIADDFAPIELNGEAARNTFESLPAGKAKRREIPEAKHLTTDQANANRLVKHFKRTLVVASDRWYAWTGTHWEHDESEVCRTAMKLSAIIHREADQWKVKPADTSEEKEKNLEIAERIEKWALRSEMKGTIDAALNLAKRLLAVPAEMLDCDPWALNCLNGTVDLRTGLLRKHNPEDYITRVVALEYDPDAEAPLFESVLAKVTVEEGLGSKPLASFLQRWFGYCCTASTREQKFVVHYGNGRNGKSTILDLIAEVMGTYAGTGAPGLLVSSGQDRHPTEIADLFGRRMVTAHETGDGGVLREDFVKQATGGDRIKARYMRADFFEFSPTHKIQLLTNYKPVIKGQDEGIWRRVLLVPYMARFGSPEEIAQGVATHVRDTTIAERLTAEKQGVLTWLVEGAMEWFRDGLRAPDVVMAASKDYQTEQDKLLQFVREECETNPSYECVLTGDHDAIYPAYQQWCKQSGYHPLGKTRMGQEIERVVPHFRKVVKKRVQGEKRRDFVVFCGLRLANAL